VTGSDPSTVDGVTLARDSGTVVCREEENEARYLFGTNHSFERLGSDDLGLVGFGEPEALLPFGLDGSRHDAVDADVACSQLVGHGSGHAYNGSFGGDIHGEVGGGKDPGDGTHVDDRAAAGFLHGRDHTLRHEELCLEIDRHRPIPGRGCDVGKGMAGVVSGVVDENIDRAKARENLLRGGLQGIYIGEIAVEVRWWIEACGLQAEDQLLGCAVLNIEEDDLRPLACEGLDDRFPNAAGAAGDDDDTIRKAGIDRVDGRSSFLCGWLARVPGRDASCKVGRP